MSPTLRRALGVFYVVLSVATTAALWLAGGSPVKAWIFGAIACGAPAFLPDRKADKAEQSKNSTG